MGADIGAHVALDAVLGDPHGHIHRDSALFKGGGALGNGAVHAGHELGDGDGVPLHVVGGDEDVLHVVLQVGPLGVDHRSALLPVALGPLGGDVQLGQRGQAGVHRRLVHGHDVVALVAVGLDDGGLHVLHRVIDGDDVGQLEEGGLEDHVGAVAQADLPGQAGGVTGVDLHVVLGQVLLGPGGEDAAQVLDVEVAVDEQGAAGLDVLDDVVFAQISRTVAGHEVRPGDVVGGADVILAEAQVGDGHAARLLGVVLEVGLHPQLGVVADDLDGVLVGAHGSVGPQAPELAAHGARRGDLGLLGDGQGQVGHVVGDIDGEAVHRVHGAGVAVGRQHAARSGVLGAQAVPAAHHPDVPAGVVDRGAHVHVQGLADGAGLLTAVHGHHVAAGLGDGGQEALGGEGPEQAHLDQAHLHLAALIEVVAHLLGAVAHGAHGHHDGLGVGGAVVVEQLVVLARLLVDLVHAALDDVGQAAVVVVDALLVLEEDVRVLGRTAQHRVVGVQGALPELLQLLPVHHLGQVLVVPGGDLADLVGGAEAVEEVDEGHVALDGGQVGHGAQIHALLGVDGAQHGVPGGTAGHHVRVVAEDGQGVGGHRPGGDVDDVGLQAAGDLVHVGDHQQQALGGSEGGGEGAGGQRAVDRAGGPRLRLHLGDAHRLAEDVLPAGGAPLIGQLRHDGRGGDGVDGSHLGKGVGHVRRSGIAIHGDDFSFHGETSFAVFTGYDALILSPFFAFVN